MISTQVLMADDEGDEDEDDAVDELAPVDADAVIRRGEAWSDPVRKSTVSHGTDDIASMRWGA